MELFHRILYSAFGAASIVYFFIKFSLSYWKKRGILHKNPSFLWGNLKGVGSRRHIAHALHEVYELYKDTEAPFVGFYFFIKPMIMVLKLDVIHQILNEDFEYFSDRGFYCNAEQEPLLGNLMRLDGEEWRKLRTQICPVFEYNHLVEMYPKLMQVANTFRETLLKAQSQKDVFNINELVESYNVDVIASLSFGLNDINSLLNAEVEFRQMCQKCYSRKNLLMDYLAFSYPNLAKLLQYRSIHHLASIYFSESVETKMNERSWLRREKPTETDFLQMFMDLDQHENPKTGYLRKKEIAALAFSFVHHGLEALNVTLAFCLYELALQPKLQDQVRTEIKEVLAKNSGTLNVESLKEMKYMDQVLSETIRLHPPFTFLLRKTTQDYEIPDSIFILKKGNHIIIPVAAIHHDPRIYQNPAQFDPNRFSPSLVDQRHPMSCLPFGYGPRNCVAAQFAKVQALVGLVTLLRDFEFSVCSETEIPFDYDFKRLLLRPKFDIVLKVERV